MYIEDNLDIPFKKVLSIMQKGTFNTYFGVQAIKNPIDAWVYQEIIFEIKPDIIIEIGNHKGGGLLYLAHLCDLLGHGTVIGIDIDHSNLHSNIFNHQRIVLFTGDACSLFDTVRSFIGAGQKVLIIDDSSHEYKQTLDVLNTFSSLVSVGSYFIVEDGICHHGIDEGPNPGPYEAVTTFLEGNINFESDRSRESFFITWNPKGYLRRKS